MKEAVCSIGDYSGMPAVIPPSSPSSMGKSQELRARLWQLSFSVSGIWVLGLRDIGSETKGGERTYVAVSPGP